MRQRLLFLLLIAASLVALGTPARPNAAVAQPADGSRVEVVRAGYDLLLDYFVRPLEPAALLTDGWLALTDVLRDAGLSGPPPLPPLPPERDEAFARFAGAYRAYVAAVPPEVERLTLALLLVGGMAESLEERHTYVLSPAQFRSRQLSAGGGQLPVGFGFQRTARPPYTVTYVAPESAAERGGLWPGDVLLAINGRDVSYASAQEFSQAAAGPSGSTATLTVDRGTEREELALSSGPYYIPPLESRVLPDGTGYLRLREYVSSGVTLPNGTELLADLDRQLDALDAAGITGLVLDVRGNGGGSAVTWRELLGRFVPEDTLTLTRFDARGRETTGLVSGTMRAAQYPMAVLVDGSSASASEITAAVLKEANRAVLVGQQTAGVVSGSVLLALPEGAGLQIGTVESVTALGRVKIDEVGYPVDLVVADTRTAEDYRQGTDPQLAAAVAALATAPPPPEQQSESSPYSAGELRALLSRYLPAPEQIPTNDRLTRVIATGSFTNTHVNQAIGESTRNPLAARAEWRRRGWLGSHGQGYGVDFAVPPGVGVGIEIYATSEGAAQSLSGNDAPDLAQAIQPPVLLGDQTVAYRGVWRGLGDTTIIWRHGNVVLSVSYSDLPGPAYERTDVLVAVARLVDETYTRAPLPELVGVGR